MAAISLALGSSITWGLADFLGGAATRRLPLAPVTVWSQAAGLAGLLVVLGTTGGGLDGRAVGLGLAAGFGGGIGLATFYKALALGTMSVVSPVTACGAIVPVGLALALGERPSALALAGTGIALAGAVLASAEEHSAAGADNRRAVLLSVVAAVALGLFIYFLGRASERGDTLSALVGARLGSLTTLLAWAGATRASLRIAPRALALVAGIGLVDLTANGLFALASGRALLAIVAVLGSLYPVTTVLLAHVLLGERLSTVQKGGVALALAGVSLVSAG